MSVPSGTRGTFTIWRILLLTQLRESPARLLVTVLAIALGVALGAAVFLVNTAALNEFGLATKRLVGEADVVVRGPREGFPEQLFTHLASDPAVGIASPVLELEVALPGRRDPLKVLGLDPFRAASLQPALIGDIGAGILAMLRPDGIYLSSSAAQELHVGRGDPLQITVGSTPKTLHVLGILSEGSYTQPLGLMDIASAQWTFDQIGRLNRIDLRLKPGNDVDAFRHSLGEQLPAGVLAVAPQVERDRAVSVTRAYRVNLNMLALVALWTGAFLVFSTQSLAVLRRRRSLALLRALGVTRGQLQWALTGEGAALGVAGSLLGVILAVIIAAAILRFLTADLGNGQLRAVGASLRAAPLPMLVFFLLGTAVASVGAWLPARAAARQPPARALKGGNGDYSVAARRSTYAGVALLAMGALLSRIPPVAGLPVFGYLAIASLLFGAVLLVPTLTIKALSLAPRTHRVVIDAAVAQLRENVGLSTLSLASIIVSFSLMVAMAIMVFSFRVSFEHWLTKLLPADMQLREPYGNDTAYWSPADQAALATVAGVSRIDFRRSRPLLLDAKRAPITLIARGATDAQAAAELPLLQSLKPPSPATAPPSTSTSRMPAAPMQAAPIQAAPQAAKPMHAARQAAPPMQATPQAAPPMQAAPQAAPPMQAAPRAAPPMQAAPQAAPPSSNPAWISEALADLYGYKIGDRIDLPLAGRNRAFIVSGIWRDYARTTGAIVISRPAYLAATGDTGANEGSIWLAPGADPTLTESALRSRFTRGDSLEILTSTALRERSLQIFDRAFAITYALEAIAVVIGLTGVSFAASSTALARRAEFGMLRHIGMLRRQVIGMLASEGTLTSAFGVAYGLVLGLALSLILVYVVNRQSFNWSIDLAIPAWQLAVLSVTLIAAAAVTAVWSGRAAMSQDAVQAVREDW